MACWNGNVMYVVYFYACCDDVMYKRNDNIYFKRYMINDEMYAMIYV